MVPHMVNCIHCNSCNSFNNIHVVEICLVTMKLEVVIATQNLVVKPIANHFISLDVCYTLIKPWLN